MNKLVGGLIPLVRFHRYISEVEVATVVEIIWRHRRKPR